MENSNILNISGSILDRVLSSQASKDREGFDPITIVKEIIDKNLLDKEADVVYLRHGLRGGESKTLKDVGLVYNITRERVRQIEKAALNKLRAVASNNAGINQAKILIHQALEDNGGAMTENSLLREVLAFTKKDDGEFTALKFILKSILNDKFPYVAESVSYCAYWKTPLFSPALITKAADLAKEILSPIGKPLSRTELWSEILKHENYQIEWSQYNSKSFFSVLAISKKVRANIFDEWGLSIWKTIMPKRMNDKIYLILKRCGKPLHFMTIADEINKAGFDKKKAYHATIHNELILNKGRYILVGRGVYALSEWGYRPGVVADVVKEVLSGNPQGLTKDQVIAEVLKKRQVRTGTIYLALMNKNIFEKKGGKYYLKQQETVVN